MGPKKQTGSPEEQMVSLSYKDFMDSQNRVAHALNVYYNMTSHQLEASSQQMSAIKAAMLQLQTFTKSTLVKIGLDDTKHGMEAWPAITDLLSKDKHTIGNPLGDPLGEVLMPQPKGGQEKAVKTRKPKKIKDPNAPNRPVTAYFLYLAENKDAVRRKLGPDAKAGEVQKKGTEDWNALPESEQEVYKAQYRDHFADYKRKMKEYQANGGRVSSVDLEPADDAVNDKVNGRDDDAVGETDSEDESESSSDESEEEHFKTPSPPPRVKASTKTVKESKKGSQKAGPATIGFSVRQSSPPVTIIKEKSPEKRKRTVTEESPEKKRKKTAKEDSPEDSRKSKGSKEQSPEMSKRRKRKSKGGDPEVEKIKYRHSFGNDY